MWSNDNVLSFLPTLTNNSTLFQLGKKGSEHFKQSSETCLLAGGKSGHI